MQLRGQAGPENAPGRDDLGYAMAVLLIGLSVMAILMTIAMPVWKHDAQREKEAELVFRGEQYGRALSLFQRKHGPGTTPTRVDALLEDHVLRKKFKDPITNDDFDVLLQGQNAAGSTPTPVLTSQRGGTTSTAPQGSSTAQRGSGPGGASPSSSGPVGGIFGFASKSKAESIRLYKGHSHYNEWLFTAPQFAQAPGAGGAPGGVPGTGGPGGRGGPGQGPGGIPGTGGPGGRGVGPGGRGNITVLPNGQIIDPRTGQPLVDPRTGQPLTLPPGARGGGRGPGR
jgi:type II secretory pathway pseudopilin PulG